MSSKGWKGGTKEANGEGTREGEWEEGWGGEREVGVTVGEEGRV